MRASGMAVPEAFPFLGGHEGAGVVAEVGPGVRSVAAGRPRRDVLHPGLRSVPVLRFGHDVSVRSRRGPVRQGDGDRRHRATPRRRRGVDGDGSARHVRRIRRGRRAILGADRRRGAVPCGRPGVVRGDHRLGVGDRRRRAPSGRHGGGDRHRGGRHERAPGRAVGWCQVRRRCRSRCLQAGFGDVLRRDPHRQRRCSRPSQLVRELTARCDGRPGGDHRRRRAPRSDRTGADADAQGRDRRCSPDRALRRVGGAGDAQRHDLVAQAVAGRAVRRYESRRRARPCCCRCTSRAGSSSTNW